MRCNAAKLASEGAYYTYVTEERKRRQGGRLHLFPQLWRDRLEGARCNAAKLATEGAYYTYVTEECKRRQGGRLHLIICHRIVFHSI